MRWEERQGLPNQGEAFGFHPNRMGNYLTQAPISSLSLQPLVYQMYFSPATKHAQVFLFLNLPWILTHHYPSFHVHVS